MSDVILGGPESESGLFEPTDSDLLEAEYRSPTAEALREMLGEYDESRFMEAAHWVLYGGGLRVNEAFDVHIATEANQVPESLADIFLAGTPFYVWRQSYAMDGNSGYSTRDETRPRRPSVFGIEELATLSVVRGDQQAPTSDESMRIAAFHACLIRCMSERMNPYGFAHYSVHQGEGERHD